MLAFLSKKKVIEYHNSCSTISLHAFYQHAKTKDYRDLVVGWNEKEEINFDNEKASKAWSDVFEHYLKLKNDNKMTVIFQTQSELIYHQTKYSMVWKMCNLISTVSLPLDVKISFLNEIKEWGFTIDVNQSIPNILKKLEKSLKRLNTKITILENELNNLKGDDDGEEFVLTKIIVKMEQALNRNDIDPRKISMEKWIYMIDHVKESKSNG